MKRFRDTIWTGILSVLLALVFVQAQAAGCCKIGAWFHGAPDSRISASHASAAMPSGNAPARESGLGHGCCPNAPVAEAAEDLRSLSDPESPGAPADPLSESACCLRGADLNASGIASSAEVPSPS